MNLFKAPWWLALLGLLIIGLVAASAFAESEQRALSEVCSIIDLLAGNTPDACCVAKSES